MPVLFKKRFHSDLGTSVRNIRKSLGLSQTDIMVKTELSLPTIRKSEKGEGTFASFVQIAEVLGHELVGGNLSNKTSIGEGLSLLSQRQQLSLRQLLDLCSITVPTI